MNKYAAIDAQIVDIRNDDRHKGFIRVTLHIPQERGDELNACVPWATYTNPVPVALARLDINHAGEASGPSTERASGAGVSDPFASATSQHDASESRRGGPAPETPPVLDTATPARARSLTRQCAIACNDPRFHRFLEETNSGWRIMNLGDDAEKAAVLVRALCGVKSRAEIITGTPAAEKWDALRGRYLAWLNAPDLVGA